MIHLSLWNKKGKKGEEGKGVDATTVDVWKQISGRKATKKSKFQTQWLLFPLKYSGRFGQLVI